MEREPGGHPIQRFILAIQLFHRLLLAERRASSVAFAAFISKKASASYRSERNDWLKIKTVQKGKFPVVGSVKDPSGAAALYLGKKE